MTETVVVIQPSAPTIIRTPGDSSAALASHAALSQAHGISAFFSGVVNAINAAAARIALGINGLASDINAATLKTTPVDADEMPIADSESSFSIKKLTFYHLKTTLSNLFLLAGGKVGGQVLIGGTGIADKLTIKGTSGNGTPTATAVEFAVGNNGALTALSIDHSGVLTLQGDATTDLPTYGSELLTSAGWIVNAGWTESLDDVFTHSSGTATLTHSATIANATTYQIEWTMTARTTGSITVSVGGQLFSTITSSGSFGPTTTSTAAFTITPTTDFNGTVSLVSLKSVAAVSRPSRNVKSSTGTVVIEERGNSITGLTAFGVSAGRSNTTGVSNSNFGLSTGRYNTTGGYNSNFGVNAGYSNTTGGYNSNFGVNAGYSNTTGGSNVYLGYNAGRYHADGTTSLTNPENSIYLGYGARGKDNNDVNSIVIAYNGIGLGANTTVLGNNSTTLTRLYGDIGIGTDTASAACHVVKTSEQLRLGYNLTNYSALSVNSGGVLSIATSSNRIALGSSRTPASSSATGTAGEMCWDANYIYVCTASNTWKRAAIAAW